MLEDPARAWRIQKIVNGTCVLQDHEEDVVPVREESMTFRDSNRPVLGAGSAGGQFLSKIVSVESDELYHLLSHDVRGLHDLSL